MGFEQYQSAANEAKTTFAFISEGPKGKILKRIQYEMIELDNYENVYNLGFGDLNADATDIDDLVVTGNQDRDKVLATVINTAYIFLERHPEASIYIQGSTPSRTRLYQIIINNYFDILSESFLIEGLTEKEFLNFEKNNYYKAFLITPKIK